MLSPVPAISLAMGSHHLEYGFPSTHSTNSISIALFLFSIFCRLRNTPAMLPDALSASPALAQNASAAAAATLNMTQLAAETLGSASGEMMISQTTYTALVSVLVFYVFSIVYGRLYTGMHSFTDCAFGVVLGTAIWAGHIVVAPFIDTWIREGGWSGESVRLPVSSYVCFVGFRWRPFEAPDDHPRVGRPGYRVLLGTTWPALLMHTSLTLILILT